MPKRKKKPAPPRIYLENDTDAVKVEKIANKGNELGLVAVETLEPNTRIRYQGKEIDQEEYDELEHTGQAAYVMASGKKGIYLDGNPKHNKSWIANRINEPSKGEKANMVILMEKGGPVMCTVRQIKAGEELLIHYGRSYERTYKVGKAATPPSWLKRKV